MRSGRHPWLRHAVLIPAALLFAFPFYWLVVMSTGTTADIFSSPPRLIPGTALFDNVGRLLEAIAFQRAFANSVLVSVVATTVTVAIAALSGFVFAQYRFPGRDWLFGGLLVTMTLPTGVMLVPMFQIYVDLGWLNTYLPLIIPGAASAFGIFWMRQAAREAVQYEVIEAVRVDGAGFLRVFWHVGAPALRPAIAGFTVFQFMWNWNEYLWPLLVLNDSDLYTLPVALQQLNGSYGMNDYPVVMVGTLLATIPLIVVFLIFRKQVMSSATSGAVKG
ncbi:carbohydrate ABC transporter permease [Ruania alba]|uniref:Carbohydrate ABC transporter membrane protein 2, CUT1 family n=1 Tax=Ruania alba TaxID=648782 RepID=A0A1H5KYX8_9MICO|nr:carbohydrate ABC transporter permease [Ruania alba]SEE69920.1 carbohydrate ABC transporter membrane protein 2, CUT1 family [Ruania alba]